jgi:hypothetical protein
MFGIIATISSANIALFMIFGVSLLVSDASDFVIEFAKIVAGRFRGGSAFVAVFASALTGAIFRLCCLEIVPHFPTYATGVRASSLCYLTFTLDRPVSGPLLATRALLGLYKQLSIFQYYR